MSFFQVTSLSKINSSSLRELEVSYLKRLIAPYILTEIFLPKKIKIDTDKEEWAFDQSKNFHAQETVLLDAQGLSFSSQAFAQWIDHKLQENKKINFIIGPSEGPSSLFKTKVSMSLSLSKMTFSHQLIPLLFYEQWYRCQSINTNHPYHK